jgi:hypothetical protein
MQFNDLILRAANAIVRRCKRSSPGFIIDMSTLRIEELGDRRYVTWRVRGDPIDCYRVRNDGKLKRLVRAPAALVEGPHPIHA